MRRTRPGPGEKNRAPMAHLHRLRNVGAALLIALALSGHAAAREVTDTLGFKTNLPDTVSRVYAADPPSSVLLHVLAPDAMLGLSFPIQLRARRFYPPGMLKLPVLGGWFGGGQQSNAETVLALKPDFALAWKAPFGDLAKQRERFDRLGLPTVFITLDGLADWPAALRFVGGLLGRETFAEPRAVYVEKALARLAGSVGKVPENRRPRIYYAEGADGLATDCHSSFHTEAIELAAGYNVHRCQQKNRMGMERVSIEQVLAYDPDIIVVEDRAAMPVILHDPRWRTLRAVRSGQVHGIPHWPYNWIDRPPSVMRALGAQWLASLFHPDHFRFDLHREVRVFYHLFFGVTLTDADIDELMAS